LLAGEHVPQPELSLETAVGLACHAPGGERLRIDGAPIGEVRHSVDAGDFLEERRRIDRREQAAPLEVRGNDLRHALRGFVVARGPAEKIRDRNRHRLDVALRDIDRNRRGRQGIGHQSGQRSAAERQHAPAVNREIRQKIGSEQKRHDLNIASLATE
jgi:hypothetical protein